MEAQSGLRSSTWRLQALLGAQLGGPKQSKTPTWRPKADLRAQLRGPRAFGRAPRVGKTCQKPVFSSGFCRFCIRSQKYVRRCFSTASGDPKLSFGASFGRSKPPRDANLEAQSLPRIPTWTPKALPDPQVGGPKPFQNPNMEAQSGPRRQLGGARSVQGPILEAQSTPAAQLGGPRHSN